MKTGNFPTKVNNRRKVALLNLQSISKFRDDNHENRIILAIVNTENKIVSDDHARTIRTKKWRGDRAKVLGR